MRIISVQPNMYHSAQKMQNQTNVSHKGTKGFLTGAGAGGAAMGTIAFLALGGPAAWILGGVTAGLGGLLGNDYENKTKEYSSKDDTVKIK